MLKRFVSLMAGGACLALASLMPIQDAKACGGCFIPPMTEGTLVTGHRMVLSISPAQTVLWDQIQYSGDPAEFAWVLPVKPGAYIEVASNAFFETLDAATNVSVLQPNVTCHDPYGFDGPGCGSSYEEGAVPMAAFDGEGSTGAGAQGGPTVEVIKRVTVGPYDSVTLSTETPGALNDWLVNAGYNVDPSTQPIIDAYVAEGFDFIALKLKPEKGVREMKPVRVISAGATPVLPLRMVAVGTGANVAVTLYVIAEGRFGAQNFPNSQVPIDLLAWDFDQSRSNYAELREQTLKAADGGSAWITTYAKQGPLLGSIASPLGFGNVAYGFDPEFGPMTTIAELFLNQAVLNKETSTDMILSDDAACKQAFANLDADIGPSKALISNPCPMGKPYNDPMCGMVAPNELDARQFACGAATDLSVAVTGMHPADVWLTRIETNLPQSALKSDLTLEPSEAQSEVDNLMRARIAVNADKLCGGSYSPPSVWSKGMGDRGALVGFTMTAIAFAGALVRRRRRSASI